METERGSQKLKVVSTRITESLARVVEEYLKRDAHVSPADLLRDALREKLMRDAPELYRRILREELEGDGEA